MKKLATGLAVVIAAAGLAACGGNSTATNNTAAVDESVLNDTSSDEAAFNDTLPAEGLTANDAALIDNAGIANDAIVANATAPTANGL